MLKLVKPVFNTDPQNVPAVDLRPEFERSCSDAVALAALAKAESNIRTYAPRSIGRCDWSYDMFQHSVCFVSGVPGMSGKDGNGWLTTQQNVQAVVNALCYSQYPAAARSAGSRLDALLTEARDVLGADHPQVRLLALCRWNAPNLRKPGEPVSPKTAADAWLDPDLASWDPKHAANRKNYQASLDYILENFAQEVGETAPEAFYAGVNIDPNHLANPNHLGILGVKGVRVVVHGVSGFDWIKTLKGFCQVDVVITKDSYTAVGIPLSNHGQAAQYYLPKLISLGVRSVQLGNEPTNTGNASDLQSVAERNTMYGAWKSLRAALHSDIPFLAGAIGTGQPGDLDGVDLTGMQVALNFYDMRFDGWPAEPWGHGDLGWALPAFKAHADKTGKPLRITEIGTTSGDRKFQASYLSKVLPWLEARDDVDAAFYFTLQDEPATMNMGLLDEQGNPKAAYAEMYEYQHPDEGDEEEPVPNPDGSPSVGPGVLAAIERNDDVPKGDERYFLTDKWSITAGEKAGYIYSAESNEVYQAPKV